MLQFLQFLSIPLGMAYLSIMCIYIILIFYIYLFSYRPFFMCIYIYSFLKGTILNATPRVGAMLCA